MATTKFRASTDERAVIEANYGRLMDDPRVVVHVGGDHYESRHIDLGDAKYAWIRTGEEPDEFYRRHVVLRDGERLVGII